MRNLPIQGPAVRALGRAAREYSRYQPRANPSGAEARALQRLCEAAQVNCLKSDEQWAAEVAMLKAAMWDAVAAIEMNDDAKGILEKALEEHDG